ncbi:MAG TPA: FAD-dependent oxidoreductase [Streptosporangiaceae bacterium]|jgi:D-amino-acid dehydrogenase
MRAATPPAGAADAGHSPDVLILGGGVVGLFCAYFLRRRGASVTVVERGEIGGPQSCSYGNTGLVGTQGSAPLAEPGVLTQGLRWLADPQSPFYIKPRLDPGLVSWLWHFRRFCNDRSAREVFAVLLAMKQRSLEILTGLCATGSLAPTFSGDGIVVACKTPEGFEQACRSLPRAVALGLPLRVLEPGELAALEPETEFDISGALLNTEGAALHVPEFVTGFARQLTGMGVKICPETEATGFEVSGRRVAKVITARGEFTPAEVVIAAGAWSPLAARKLGVGLTMQPAKGYSITVKAPPNGPRRPVVLSEGKVAVMPLGDRLRFGGTLELSGLDSSVSSRRLAGIRRTVGAYLPALEPTETLETWRGFRPCTPDSLPFIGRAERYHNLSVACGHGYIGMGLAPGTGELMAQLLTGEQPEADPRPFRLDRFGRRPRRVRS